ncbi:DUF3047 domain-containing protein [Acidovorax sp.]|uniref:DUF3047 domain-containing protein n=1 Tax=Acidovorax sp. TaxID=1872122 RepID=UPI0025C3CE03|nr:DUF3047 domain-containing protein [Acidovorax sp.]MCI5068955.1 DUF3047 domain-containing protein [Acidovorax sp.]
MPLRNAPSATKAKIVNIAQRLRGRIPPLTEHGPASEALAARLRATLGERQSTNDSTVAWVPAKGLQWQTTTLELRRGDTVTLIANGVVHMLRALRVSLGPHACCWYRIGDGTIQRAPADAHTFTADTDGPLRLAAAPPGAFSDLAGNIEPSPLNRFTSGGLTVAAIRWREDAEQQLAAASRQDPALFEGARQRLESPVRKPEGWHYLWRLGEGELYESRAAEDGRCEICCQTRGDVGILQYPTDQPLSAATRLQWSWRADQLPSEQDEHIDLTHDYLSIAVEFDNGLDLTYMWSASLPHDTVFQCPLPWWKERETHWVIRRAGDDPLHTWLDESRNVAEDYDVAIGGPRPERIVGIWLIANSLFQRGVGACAYRAIRLCDEDRILEDVTKPR